MVTFDFNKTPITQIADAIIIDASNRGASDIHLDPRENGIMTRIRVDGDLVDYAYIPKMYERNLTTRIKLMSNMNITESRLPQDGAIKGKFGGKDLDMRVSCLPTNEGEKIVIRILDYTRSLAGLNNLGFNKENYQKLLRMIANPNGIILITGATGSGKSTTVYSILQTLNKEETNIITVEDPIEMNIEGMNQVQVNSEIGLDFAAVLRSILRQDPNVILIGEIRDSETAQIAVRASITGHLVLSTIHTNNSLSTIERLLDMNVEKYLLSSAITGIISQRLAKMLCPHCRQTRQPTPYEKKVFKLALKQEIDTIYTANEQGCQYCHKGYKGRIAIQEVLEITDDIKNAINKSNSNRDDLRNLVYGSGNVITLLQDGLGKVLGGLTTFEEIYRIIEIDNDIEDSCITAVKEAKTETKEIAKKLKEEEKEGSIKEVAEKTNTNVTAGAISTTALTNKNVLIDKQATNAITTKQATSILNNQNKNIVQQTPPIISNNLNLNTQSTNIQKNKTIESSDNEITNKNKKFEHYFPKKEITIESNNNKESIKPANSYFPKKDITVLQENTTKEKSIANTKHYKDFFPNNNLDEVKANPIEANEKTTEIKKETSKNNIKSFSSYFPAKNLADLKNENSLSNISTTLDNIKENKNFNFPSYFPAKDINSLQLKNGIIEEPNKFKSYNNYFPKKDINTNNNIAPLNTTNKIQTPKTQEEENINNFFPTEETQIPNQNRQKLELNNGITINNNQATPNTIQSNINQDINKSKIDNLIFPQGIIPTQPLTPITSNLINPIQPPPNNGII